MCVIFVSEFPSLLDLLTADTIGYLFKITKTDLIIVEVLDTITHSIIGRNNL